MGKKEIGYDGQSEFESAFEPGVYEEEVKAKPVDDEIEAERPAGAEVVGQYSLETSKPQAVVIHCGDPRFQRAFRNFIEEELGIRSYVPIIILGGVHAFGFKELRPKQYKVLFEQIKYLIKEKDIKRVVIINHEDCEWYGRFSSWIMKRVPLPTKQVEDLRSAAEGLFEHFLNIDIETYYAELDGERIDFKRIS
jgi:hypothetical protein